MMTKVYTIYLGKRFYAWTIDKNRRDQFLDFRARSKFIETKHNLDVEEYQEFANKYRDMELIETRIFVDGDWYNLAMTRYEQGSFTSYLDSIQREFVDAIRRLRRCDYANLLPIKVLQKIDPVIQSIEDTRTQEIISNEVLDIKELDVFYDMFRDTF